MSGLLLSPLATVLGVMAFWLVLGLLGSFAGHERDSCRLLFPASAAGGLVLAFAGGTGIGADPSLARLPFGLPDLPFHLRLDNLSAFFILLAGLTATGVSLFSTGYFRTSSSPAPGPAFLQYQLFLVAMVLVILADDTYVFLLAWETMALASYFLVVSDHAHGEIRSAGLLYLIVAHVGALALLGCFGILQGETASHTFEAIRAGAITPEWSTAAFALALFGFGAKAGVIPLHAWLPEAHPAAPSPVSALMSGIMLKTAIYGLLRVTFDLLEIRSPGWGVAALGLGLLGALFGVMFAAVQTDMKRLLAWSSIENIGMVLAAIGLAIVFHASRLPALSALALAAALFHCLNHALFKSLLFLATGAVMHATAQRSLGHLGGLIHRMPWVAGLALVGALGIAGLPPLNGFVSEWMLLQAFLLSPALPDSYLRMMVPVATAALVLAAAFAAYVMVKFYGIVFLGQPRETDLKQAPDADFWQRSGMGFIAGCCILLSVFPGSVMHRASIVAQSVVDAGAADGTTPGVLLLAPVSSERASYVPAACLAVLAAAVLSTYLLVRLLRRGRPARRAPAWDCGFPAQTARMQDTAEGFGQPVKQIFEVFFRIERSVPSPFDPEPRYWSRTGDRLWYALYLPVTRLVNRLSEWASLLQRGRIHRYLIYSFVTLLALLILIRA